MNQSANSNTMAMRAVVHQLAASSRRHHHVPTAITTGKVSAEQWIRNSSEEVSEVRKPKKNVSFAVDENDCVRTSIHTYDSSDKDETSFSADAQMGFSVNAKLEGRRFYRRERKTVSNLEKHHRECSAFQ